MIGQEFPDLVRGLQQVPRPVTFVVAPGVDVDVTVEAPPLELDLRRVSGRVTVVGFCEVRVVWCCVALRVVWYGVVGLCCVVLRVGLSVVLYCWSCVVVCCRVLFSVVLCCVTRLSCSISFPSLPPSHDDTSNFRRLHLEGFILVWCWVPFLRFPSLEMRRLVVFHYCLVTLSF